MTSLICVDARTLASILAGLRLLQTTLLYQSEEIGGIATDIDTIARLTESEIDSLCERLNSSAEHMEFYTLTIDDESGTSTELFVTKEERETARLSYLADQLSEMQTHNPDYRPDVVDGRLLTTVALTLAVDEGGSETWYHPEDHKLPLVQIFASLAMSTGASQSMIETQA
jgi:hypothetical protein